MPEDDGCNSIPLREPFDGTPETIFAMPSARTDTGRPACGICATSENEAVVTRELVKACSNGLGIEVAISKAHEEYNKYVLILALSLCGDEVFACGGVLSDTSLAAGTGNRTRGCGRASTFPTLLERTSSSMRRLVFSTTQCRTLSLCPRSLSF